MTDTPFKQGSQAYLDDAPTAACAFPQGSTMHREWIEGWSQRQVRERAHRSRAIGEMNLQDLLGDQPHATLARLFGPIDEIEPR